MTISVQCECGKRYKVGDDKAGKRIKCRECGAAVSIPARDDEFDDDEYGSYDDSSEAPPKPPRSQSKRGSKKKSKNSASSSTLKYVLAGSGVFVVFVGVIIGILFMTGVISGGSTNNSADPSTVGGNNSDQQDNVSTANSNPKKKQSPAKVEESPDLKKLWEIGVQKPLRFAGSPAYTVENITYISFYNMPEEATDAHCEFIKRFPNVVDVELSEQPNITDKALIHLAEMKKLKKLHFQTNKITDVGVKRLTALTEMEDLFLTGASISDNALKDIAKLKKLKRLSLEKTPITDAGLEHLKGLKNLEQLLIWSTRATKAGVERLKQSLPNCSISNPDP